MLTLSDIKAAYDRVKSYVHATPVVQSDLLNGWLGHDIYFKAECFQTVGAFKARGACNAVQQLLAQHADVKKVVANSSGNHAQAVAWSARTFGLDATIFMPAFASQVKAQATRSYGADVILAETRQVVDAMVFKAAQKSGTYWVPPFNDLSVMAGQGTAALEAWSQLNDEPDAVFAPCGGGGLLSGTLAAVRGLSGSCQVMGAEPLVANDAAISLRQGSIYTLTDSPKTLADGAMTLSVGDLTFPYLQQLDDFFEVSERDIAYWTQWLQHLLKLHIEPTSAMTMGAVFQWLSAQKKRRKVLVIISGGNIEEAQMRRLWAQNHLATQPQLFK